jgi:hypothetical protein
MLILDPKLEANLRFCLPADRLDEDPPVSLFDQNF